MFCLGPTLVCCLATLWFATRCAAETLSPAQTTSAARSADAGEEIAALRREIARHDRLYHRQAAPEISDADYDQLKRRLAEWEKAFPDVASALPPLAEIGDDRSGAWPTARHRERMLSLEKAYTAADLRAFCARVAKLLGGDDLEYVIEPKFDGVAVSVTYEQGRLVRAVTRGNGVEGDNITINAEKIAGLPQRLRVAGSGAAPIPDKVEVRGEIFVPFAEFARVNAEREAAGMTSFANPRNLAAGTLRLHDSDEITKRGLRIVFYGLGACEPEAALPARHRELAARFEAWGLPRVEHVWFARGVVELVQAVEEVQRARREFAFPTDGAVVKVDALAQQRALGAAESAPRWAVAYKFPPERIETQVRAITLQVGRTGVLTPVAELAPVALAGSTISRATLHNREEIARKDIRVGDFVYLEKAGEIIPAIVGVNRARRSPAATPYVFPTTCPGCGIAVAERIGEVAIRCANSSCVAQLRRRLEHFASKACVDVAGLGPATINALVEAELVRDMADLYALERDDLLSKANMSRKSADELLRAIETSKRTELWRFVQGFGIPGVGAVTAREVAARVRTLEGLLVLEGSEGADPAIRAFFADERNRGIVTRLVAAGVQSIAQNPAPQEQGLTAKIFVLTGTLPTLTRIQARQRIEAAGGKVSETVSRGTSYVVAGVDAGAKLEQAQRLGVPVIDEEALLRLLGGPLKPRSRVEGVQD